MSITTTCPDTDEVRGTYAVEDGTSIGSESLRLKARLRELESILADGSNVTLLRDREGTAYALIDGDPRFDSLCLLDDGFTVSARRRHSGLVCSLADRPKWAGRLAGRSFRSFVLPFLRPFLLSLRHE